MMGKNVYLPGLALIGGVLGLGLRLWQRRVSFDPETLLFPAGGPAPVLRRRERAKAEADRKISHSHRYPPPDAHGVFLPKHAEKDLQKMNSNIF